MSKTQFLTPTKAARGLGSAKSGTLHHVRQRVTAIALLFLVPWFLYAIISAVSGGYEGALAWVSHPVNAILLLLTAGTAFYHMRLGMQIVIEDYIATTGTRSALLILNTFATTALFVVVAVSVLRIWTAG